MIWLPNGKVHEQSWDAWEMKYLKLIMETVRALLNELFILPSLKKDKKKEIEAMLEDIKEGRRAAGRSRS